jgi:tetratricopeptide (TPR) repeat protein
MQVTRLKPRDYETWCEVGKVSWLLGDTLMTIQAYTASIKARKYYVDPYYLLANVYIVSRQHQKAIELMDAFLKIYPREAEGVFIVAACYYAMSDFNAALSKADALLNENPGFQRAQLLRGLCHFKLGNKQAALQEFEQLKQAGYENIDLYIRMVKQ